jgi:hypothetical protein
VHAPHSRQCRHSSTTPAPAMFPVPAFQHTKMSDGWTPRPFYSAPQYFTASHIHCCAERQYLRHTAGSGPTPPADVRHVRTCQGGALQPRPSSGSSRSVTAASSPDAGCHRARSVVTLQRQRQACHAPSPSAMTHQCSTGGPMFHNRDSGPKSGSHIYLGVWAPLPGQNIPVGQPSDCPGFRLLLSVPRREKKTRNASARLWRFHAICAIFRCIRGSKALNPVPNVGFCRTAQRPSDSPQ